MITYFHLAYIAVIEMGKGSAVREKRREGIEKRR